MLKIIDKIIVSDLAPKGNNVLWLQPTKKGYQIKVKLGDRYTVINNGSTEEYEYVDLGLPSGTLWATCNVGANSPEEYGNYYAWGETLTKDEYTTENSLTNNKEISDISGNPQYDASRVHWGNAWRLPTNTEFQELIDNCNWEWVRLNNINGYKVTGNNNSIFLPAAGFYDLLSPVRVGAFGYYWSSMPNNDNSSSAYHLSSYQDGRSIRTTNRYYGVPVRPVKSK